MEAAMRALQIAMVAVTLTAQPATAWMETIIPLADPETGIVPFGSAPLYGPAVGYFCSTRAAAERIAGRSMSFAAGADTCQFAIRPVMGMFSRETCDVTFVRDLGDFSKGSYFTACAGNARR